MSARLLALLLMAPGAEIIAAHPKPALFVIQGEASGDAAAFSPAPNDVSGRADTAAFVSWDVPLWPGAGVSEATPDLPAVVQEIVNGPSWASGNALTPEPACLP